MSEMITVPFSHLVLFYREIGIHRGRTWGFRDVFGFRTLRDVPFVTLASRVKDAYEGRDVPSHCGWHAQREALRWLVEKGHAGIYALDEQGIKLTDSRPDALDEQGIKLTDSRPDTLDEQGIKLTGRPERYYISDGHHRALALYVLGEDEVRARVLGEDEVRARVKR